MQAIRAKKRDFSKKCVYYDFVAVIRHYGNGESLGYPRLSVEYYYLETATIIVITRTLAIDNS
jgi:hypothetical protein